MKLAFAPVAMLLLAALSGDSAGTFRYSDGPAPESLDPHKISGNVAANVALNLFTGLTAPDPRSMQPQPAAAEKWEIAQDGKRYIFRIRSGMKWSDGAALTARDFVDSWRRALDPKLANPYAYLFYPIKNARAYNEGRLRDGAKLGLSAPQPDRFEVELETPTAYFLQLTMMHSFLPVPMHAIAKFADKWTRPENLVTNGPFRLDSFDGKTMIMSANPQYWQRDAVKLRRVEARFGDDAEMTAQRYKDGQSDFTGDVFMPEATVKRLGLEAELESVPWLATVFLRLNCQQAPLDRVEFRRALSLAIDRDALVREVTRGGETAAASLVPAELLDGTTRQSEASYQPQAARKLLADLGYCVPEGKAPCKTVAPLEVLDSDGGEYAAVLAAVAKMWRQTLGVETVVKPTTRWSDYLASMKEGKYQIARSRWIADYPDANSFLQLFTPGGGNNRTYWSSDEFQKLARLAEAEVVTTKRHQLLVQATAVLDQEMPVIPLYAPVRRYLLKPRVSGFFDNPFHQLRLQSISVDEEAKR